MKIKLPRSHNDHIPRVIPKGIYLLPSLFTMANIFCGFYSIVCVINHYRSDIPINYHTRAAIFIFIAGVLDLLDGRIARLTHSSSPFGAQLDSLADIISFGIAPGVLAYSWALEDFHRLGWIPAFLFLGCGGIRLARFNVLEEEKTYKSSRYFLGLPIPAAAGLVASTVLVIPKVEGKGLLSFIILAGMYFLSFLMVSRFRYRSFKDVDWTRRRPIGTLFFIVVLLIVILHEPTTMIFLLACSYVASGVIAYFLPDASLRFFRKLDQIFLGVMILDDEDSPAMKESSDQMNQLSSSESESDFVSDIETASQRDGADRSNSEENE